MILCKRTSGLQEYLRNKAAGTGTAGFVPTMGALHAGHLSLIETARKAADITVCSIFVNPTQFNDPNDFNKYPVTLEKDIALLEAAGTDVLFLPTVEEMYPRGLEHLGEYALGTLDTVLEGRYRPGHFQGVCQVMSRLLEKVNPHLLFMGQKDYQQCMVVGRLLQLLHAETRLIPCPTLREPDGLAMSSRNLRLSESERKRAPAIYRSLAFIRDHLAPGPVEILARKARSVLENEGFAVDYLSIADRDTLETVTEWDGRQPLVVLVAAWLGDIRLIDNLVLS